jgi:hypothetical protein
MTKLLKLMARHPLTSLAFVCSFPLMAIAALVAGRFATQDDAASNPRAVLGRVWFDRYPQKSTDEVQIWIWLGGGIGFSERGSYWRASMDIFEFERQGDKLSMIYLQDKKTAETRFKVTPCDDTPPFDLCLDLTTSLGGRTRYYGFGDIEDMGARVPWSKTLLRAAEARATAPR